MVTADAVASKLSSKLCTTDAAIPQPQESRRMTDCCARSTESSDSVLDSFQ